MCCVTSRASLSLAWPLSMIMGARGKMMPSTRCITWGRRAREEQGKEEHGKEKQAYKEQT